MYEKRNYIAGVNDREGKVSILEHKKKN